MRKSESVIELVNDGVFAETPGKREEFKFHTETDVQGAARNKKSGA